MFLLCRDIVIIKNYDQWLRNLIMIIVVAVFKNIRVTFWTPPHMEQKFPIVSIRSGIGMVKISYAANKYT